MFAVSPAGLDVEADVGPETDQDEPEDDVVVADPVECGAGVAAGLDGGEASEGGGVAGGGSGVFGAAGGAGGGLTGNKP